ncbi:MAG: hypothetical protein U1E21_05905 [Reyranellaceae bacterium]
MLIMANYTTTNWLIRGAMAELSAAMLLPWALGAFVQWLSFEEKRYRVNVVFGLVIGVLFLAHSVLAFYVTLLFGASSLILIFSRQLPLRRMMPLPLLVAGASFALIASPYMIVMRMVVSNYDMSRMLSFPYLPEHQIQPIARYIWDTKYEWGNVWGAYTVQLDTPALGLMIAGLIASIANRSVRTTMYRNDTASEWVSVSAIIIIMFISLFMQTSWAVPFYRHFPGAAYLQFPWRLLAVITPILIVVSLWLWQRQPAAVALPCVTGALVASLMLSGVWYSTPYDEKRSTLQLAGLRFGWFDEYVPAKADTEIRYTANRVAKILEQAGCNLRSLPATKNETGEDVERDYVLSCDRPGTYPLPLFGSSLHVVQVSGLGEVTAPGRCSVAAEAPPLCAVTLKQRGRHEIRVKMPTLGRFFGL